MKYFTAVLVLLVLAMAHTSNALSMSQVAGYWKRGGGSSSSCPTAVAVAWAESHGNPRARGNNPGSYDRGLWQINSKWHPDVSDSCAYNAACNAKNAVRISSGGSRWSPWATYNHGKHRQYLSQARSACSNSRDEDGSVTVPESGSRTWGDSPSDPNGQLTASWSGLSAMLKDLFGKKPEKTNTDMYSRDEDDYTGGVTIPDSGSKTWGKPEGRFGQGHVNWSGLSNLFKDSDDDALGFGGLRMCCQAMIDSCLRCHARNRMIMQQLRDSRMKDDDDQLGFDDFGRPSHTRPHMPDSKSVGDWLNFRL